MLQHLLHKSNQRRESLASWRSTGSYHCQSQVCHWDGVPGWENGTVADASRELDGGRNIGNLRMPARRAVSYRGAVGVSLMRRREEGGEGRGLGGGKRILKLLHRTGRQPQPAEFGILQLAVASAGDVDSPRASSTSTSTLWHAGRRGVSGPSVFSNTPAHYPRLVSVSAMPTSSSRSCTRHHPIAHPSPYLLLRGSAEGYCNIMARSEWT